MSAKNTLSKKLLILGIDGMDSFTTNRLLREGKMPNLSKYLEVGASGEGCAMLGALPTITPPCWTTLATGAWPATHGITCYWRQSAENLDAVVYNMDSRNCTAEPLWNVSAESGKKTLVWHWPGSSWPPTSDSRNLHVIDGTQPGSVNMGISQMDWEKIVVASEDFSEVRFINHTEKAAGVGCVISDLEAVTDIEDSTGNDGDEMMELWWGDKARVSGEEIRTYVKTNEDTETFIGGKVGYDSIHSPLILAEGFPDIPQGAKEFTVLVSSGAERRHGLIWQDSFSGAYRIRLYRDKCPGTQPFVEFGTECIAYAIDEATKNGETRQVYRGYKLLDVSDDGKTLRIWISNALDISNDTLWYPKSLLEFVRESVGEVPPVSLIGGENSALVEKVFLPSWDSYNSWQASALRSLIDENEYELVFSHLHNVDCAGHQFWHLANTLTPWSHTDEDVYRGFIEDVYIQTDNYIGAFLDLIDQGWTIFILSDHGLLVGENIPPLLGEYGGLNVPIMESLGYTILKKDEKGNVVDEVNWEKTTAVQIRSNYIYINLRGRDKHGIVDPSEKYALEEKIISDLYAYRDSSTKKRVVGIALRKKRRCGARRGRT